MAVVVNAAVGRRQGDWGRPGALTGRDTRGLAAEGTRAGDRAQPWNRRSARDA